MPKQEAVRLSNERILAAAHEIVAAEGLDALSMRRLAKELDVWPMSVYRYFRDKDELLDALAASAADEIALPRPGASWREQMVALLEQARAAMSTDTGSRLPRAFLTPAVLRISEAGLAILDEAGFAKDDAARAWRTLWSYTFGFATFALGSTPAEARRRTRSALAALPEEQYPALTAAADEVAAAFAADEAFHYGLERLLDELAGRSERVSAPTRSRA
jgi:TetR/AcrR family transcriptional regulator, tetracycline repressor protein